jgi:hypothetical protein
MLDNAKGLDADDPSHPFSRGLLIALDENSSQKTAEIAAHYDHPEMDDKEDMLAFRRGNYQPLPNGNVFMCWSERALQSEHSADGKMLMQAKLKTKFLGTYRAYKFEFKGMPEDPPDAVARTVVAQSAGGTQTVVHVSWNGATEVVSLDLSHFTTNIYANRDLQKSWNLYKTTKRNKPRVLVDQQSKSGFETKLSYDGYAQYVIAEALDSDGFLLGKSMLLKIEKPNITTPAVEEEEAWQKDPSNRAWYDSPLVIGAAGLFVCIAALLAVFTIIRRLRQRGGGSNSRSSRRRIGFMDILKRGRYAPLRDGSEKELQDQQSSLMNGHRRGGRRRRSNDDDWNGADYRDGEGEAFVVGDEEEEEGDERMRGRGRGGDVDLDRLEEEEGMGAKRR